MRLTVLANYNVLNWFSINIHLVYNSIDWNNYRRAWKSEIGQYREEWGWDVWSFFSLYVKWSYCSCNILLAQVSGTQNNHLNMHIWICHYNLTSFLPSAETLNKHREFRTQYINLQWKINIFMVFAWSCLAQMTRWSQKPHCFLPINFESVDISSH